MTVEFQYIGTIDLFSKKPLGKETIEEAGFLAQGFSFKTRLEMLYNFPILRQI